MILCCCCIHAANKPVHENNFMLAASLFLVTIIIILLLFLQHFKLLFQCQGLFTQHLLQELAALPSSHAQLHRELSCSTTQ